MLSTLKRFFQRSAVQWDAAGQGSRLANWNAPAASPNQWSDNPIWIRSRAESEYRNNPWARKIVDSIVAAAIGGSGLNPQFKESSLRDAWARWADTCDAGGRLDWIAIQQLILQTWIVSGEVFVRLIVSEDAAAVPLCLQVLGPEFLDVSRQDRDTIAGIRYNGARRVGYWLFERHPGFTPAPMQSVFVPVGECFHLFKPHAPGVERGVTWLAPVLLPLRELQEYTEASLVRAKVGALFAGFVRSETGTNPLQPAAGSPTLEPGSMVRLMNGESVDFSEPPDVGQTFDPFVRAQLRKIASGVGIPYETLANDISVCTFASGRMSLLEWKRQIENVQHGLLVAQFCAPLLARWMQIGESLGVVSASGKARWIGPQLSMLDERAEVGATVAKIRSGLTSRSEAVSQTGWSVDDIDRELAADNARADGLGLVLDSDPRRVTQQGQEQMKAADPVESK